jgi:hypothetical protein
MWKWYNRLILKRGLTQKVNRREKNRILKFKKLNPKISGKEINKKPDGTSRKQITNKSELGVMVPEGTEP